MMLNSQPNRSIKKWANDDRPREKMIMKGKSSLSDAELLAIIIGSGTKRLSAVQLAKEILSDSNNSIDQLSKLTISDLMKYNGIGEAKAVSIYAALELARRKLIATPGNRVKIKSSKDAFNYLKGYFMDLPHEEFYVLLLNRANEILEHQLLSQGGMTGTVVDGRLLFKKGMEKNATGMILAHNHPSGNIAPSDSDKQLTKSLVEFGRFIDIQILDHLVIADNNYYSFVDEGIMP